MPPLKPAGYRQHVTLELTSKALQIVNLRQLDQAWGAELYQLAIDSGRTLGNVVSALLRDHYKSASDDAMIEEMHLEAARDDVSFSHVARRVLRPQVQRFLTQHWAIPINAPGHGPSKRRPPHVPAVKRSRRRSKTQQAPGPPPDAIDLRLGNEPSPPLA